MDDPGSNSLIAKILIIIVFILINALLSAVEMSFTSIDRKKIDNLNDIRSKKIIDITSKPQRFIATIGFLKSIIAFSMIIYIFHILRNTYDNDGIRMSLTVASLILVVVVAIVNVSFSDLIPRRVAIQNPYNFARGAVFITDFLIKISTPFIFLTTKITDIFMKIFGIESKKVEKEVTIEEIKSIVQIGENQGVINQMEGKMINSVIGFEETVAEEIMTARPEVYMIDINDSEEKYLSEMLDVKYSRIPVYDNDIDNILGILYIKDYLIEAYNKGFENVRIRNLIKPGYFVPERIEINKLFSGMQKNNTHIALLIDEYGGFSGIVTMEDLMEEIVGEIDDEYDDDIKDIRKTRKGDYIAKGSIAVKDLNEYIDIEINEDSEEYDTLAGYMIDYYGFVPRNTKVDSIKCNGYILKIMSIKENRIDKVRITKIKEEKAE